MMKFILCCVASLVLCACCSADASAQDYREKTTSLSQQMHGTLDELRAQQEVLQTALTEARNDLSLSQEQVRELRTECHDLNISLTNTNAKLADYATKSTVLEHSRNGWRKSSLIAWGIIAIYVILKVLKLLGKLHVPFI